MKVAFCFFGEIGFMDRFMIQNFIRCITTPFKRHSRTTELYYFLHSFISSNTLGFIDNMISFLPFTAISLHDQNMVPSGTLPEDYSLYRVKRLWKTSSIQYDLIVYIRIDILFSKPISENDIDLVIDNTNHLFITNHSKNLQPCFIMGNPFVMNIYADRIHSLDEDYIVAMRSQYNIKINNTISVVFVRILSGGVVDPEDNHICPYLNDLIASSCTKIHIVKQRKSARSLLQKKIL